MGKFKVGNSLAMFIATLLVMLITVAACTWEKRLYRPGYHVEWRSRNAPDKKTAAHTKKSSEKTQQEEQPESAITVAIAEPVVADNTEPVPVVNEGLSEMKRESVSAITVAEEKPVESTTRFEELKEFIMQPVSGPSKKNGLGILLGATALAAAASMGALVGSRRKTMGITRWAKQNPRATQGLIAGIHLPLVGIGLMTGYNLDQLGYTFSDALPFIAGAGMLAGYAAVPFRQKHNLALLPKTLNRYRAGYVTITLSSILMATSFGNRLEKDIPNTVFTETVRKADNWTINAASHNINEAGSSLQDQKEVIQTRQEVAGMSAGTAALLTILLILLLCSGICLAIGGIAAAAGGEPAGGMLVFVLGVLFIVLAVKGLNNVSKRRRETKAAEMKQKSQTQ